MRSLIIVWLIIEALIWAPIAQAAGGLFTAHKFQNVGGHVPALLYPVGSGVALFGTGPYDLIATGSQEALINSGTVYKVSVNIGSTSNLFGSSPRVIVVLSNGANNYTVVFAQTISAPSAGTTTTYTLSPNYTVPATGTYYLGFSFVGAADHGDIVTPNFTTGRDLQYAYHSGNLSVSSSATFTASTSDFLTVAPWM